MRTVTASTAAGDATLPAAPRHARNAQRPVRDRRRGPKNAVPMRCTQRIRKVSDWIAEAVHYFKRHATREARAHSMLMSTPWGLPRRRSRQMKTLHATFCLSAPFQVIDRVLKWNDGKGAAWECRLNLSQSTFRIVTCHHVTEFLLLSFRFCFLFRV